MKVLRQLLRRVTEALQRMQEEEKVGVGDQMLVVLKKEPQESEVQKEGQK